MQVNQIYCIFTVEFQIRTTQITKCMNKPILPKPNARQIAFKKMIDKEIKAGRYTIVRDHAHEMELFEQSRLKNAIAGTKKKK